MKLQENMKYKNRNGKVIQITTKCKDGLFEANNSGFRYYSNGVSTATGHGRDLVKEY